MLAGLVAVTSAVLILFASYPAAPGADWPWYRNGIERLIAGQPLYDPTWLAGPYDYLAPANYFQFNQVPWLIPIVAPFAVLPEPIASWVWLAFTDAAMLLALALVIPRWPPLVVIVLLSPPVLMSLAWGNTGALVALGVALWISGQRHKSPALETAGIVLASLKVLPAIPLVLLALRARRWSAAIASALIALVVSIAVSVLVGQNALEQFIRIAANIEPVLNRLNISPAAWLGASPTDYLVVRGIALVAVLLTMIRVKNDLAALALLELACCFLATNPYVDWLVVPGLAILAWAPVRRTVLRRAGSSVPLPRESST